MLSRHGIPVEVLESERGIVPSPRAIAYQFVTIELLSQVGVLDEALATGFTRTISHMRTRDAVVASTDLSVIAKDTPYPYVLHLPQHLLAEILVRRLEYEGVRVRWSTSLKALRQDKAGVTIDIEGLNGSEELWTPWLVGTDGGRSTVRKSCGISFDGMTWPETLVSTNVYCDLEAYGFAQANYIHDPDHWAVMTKISKDNLWRVVYGETPGATESEVMARMPAKVANLLPFGMSHQVTLCSPYRIHQRTAQKYRLGRVLLAGDSAHVTNPMGGLGLTSGLLDAAALTDALGSVIQGVQDESILDEYARDRQAVYSGVTSPIATESMRRMSERDEKRRGEDIAKFRQLHEDKAMQRAGMLRIAALRGQSFSAAAQVV
jgi:2-polyprenyl-6-methoxyphenol hydroxylase-like FAD-dependent oxidoreductase